MILHLNRPEAAFAAFIIYSVTDADNDALYVNAFMEVTGEEPYYMAKGDDEFAENLKYGAIDVITNEAWEAHGDIGIL
jgi:hypothetical protein